jgi:uncharacterized protein (DUF305 family)
LWQRCHIDSQRLISNREVKFTDAMMAHHHAASSLSDHDDDIIVLLSLIL